jgi:hypothetical protein
MQPTDRALLLQFLHELTVTTDYQSLTQLKALSTVWSQGFIPVGLR